MSVNAADIEDNVVKNINPDAIPSFIQKNPLNTSGYLPSQEKVSPSKKSNKSSLSFASGPASGISYFEVIGVFSSQYGGWENIAPYQGSTAPHGGSQLYTAVLQIGYGNPNPATMNGISKTAFFTQPLCGVNLHNCGVGETIVGWLYYYNYSGQQNGSFNASTNSIASPFGYWSDSVYIN